MDRLQSHKLHQTLDFLAVDAVAHPTQADSHPAAAVKGSQRVLLVNLPHQLQIEVRQP
jgi:hypothetical protein